MIIIIIFIILMLKAPQFTNKEIWKRIFAQLLAHSNHSGKASPGKLSWCHLIGFKKNTSRANQNAPN